MKILDWYFIKKFLSSFFLAIALIIVIVIVFDVSEKLDDFIGQKAPLYEIVFSYYATFIPFFTNMFSPLISFIAVVFFTSKLAYNTEIVAVFSSGISFKRLLRPYLITASFIAVLSFYLANFLIPNTNKIKIEFEDKYIFIKKHNTSRDIHVQNKPGELLYVESFSNENNIGRNFTWEKYKNENLYFKLKAQSITYDSIKEIWKIKNYKIRELKNGLYVFKKGKEIDTTFNLKPNDFSTKVSKVASMNYFELNDFIKKEKIKGSENIKFYLVEKYQRISFPLATLILSVIGVSLSSRKIRGGMGLQLAFGITLSFAYIIFMQISTVFATFGALSPLIAVWIPNIIFGIIAFLLFLKAQK